MPYLITLLLGAVSTIAASMVAKVIVGIGFTVVTYIGIGYVISGILDIIQTQISLVPLVALQTMALVKLDVAINIIISCVLVKHGQFAFNGLISKLSFSPPAP